VITVSPGGWTTAERLHAATLAEGPPVRLKGCGLSLSAALQYEIQYHEADDGRGPWRVSTKAYAYTIHGADEAEMITYHWQPGGLGPEWPHLHVGTAVLREDDYLDRRKHVPTGRVALEDVITLAIEMGAEALREDYAEVLTESRQAFHRWRTWA
jgi:hypothetical protein